MQELIANRTIGRDQPQEEVQLTELLPVEQSRIRENDIFEDANATDALKALRSFPDGSREEHDFGLHVFGFNQTSKEHSELELNDKLNDDSQSRKHLGMDVKGHKTFKTATTDEKEKILKVKSNKIGRKGSRVSLKSCRTAVRGNSELDSTDGTVKFNVKKKNGEIEKGEVIDSKSVKSRNSLKDEIYMFRCDSSEPSAEASTAHVGTDAEEIDEHYINGNLINIPAVLLKKADEIPKKHAKISLKTSIASNVSEQELQLKIDAIIQANVFTKENKNDLSQSNSSKRKNETTSITASVISNANLRKSQRSPCNENINGKAVKCSKGKDKNGNLGTAECKERENGSREEEQEETSKKYCCVVCDARFKGSGGLRNHYKVVHGAGPLFKCDECGKEFPLKERLKLHVRTHTGFKPYKCNECDKSFARGGQLVQHRRTHSQVKPYRCALCSGTFTCAANLALHLKRHNGQKDHKCEICGRGFVRRDALKKHLECLHRDVKSFLCKICNKTFKGHLPQHMRTHIRDRPYGCATCGQRFAQKSQLTVHQRTHSGQRPFRCLVCWQAFAHSTALKLHTRRHTGERPFKCAECNAGFTQLPHWKKHMKCIHGRNEPYSCGKCNSFFRIKNDLENHEKTCHPESEPRSRANNNPTINNESQEKPITGKYRIMNIERMRLLLAVLLKRISRQERLDELGFGKRLIDEVLHDSLSSAGKIPASGHGLSEFEILSKNLETFLQWTVPKEHWEQFQKMKKSPEDILETLTAT